jgi:hypothetical protein
MTNVIFLLPETGRLFSGPIKNDIESKKTLQEYTT